MTKQYTVRNGNLWYKDSMVQRQLAARRVGVGVRGGGAGRGGAGVGAAGAWLANGGGGARRTRARQYRAARRLERIFRARATLRERRAPSDHECVRCPSAPSAVSRCL